MPANNVVWTPAMDEQLLLLLEKGLSYGNCADIIARDFALPITKNACIGRGRRLQVPLRMPARKGRLCRKRESQSPDPRPKRLQRDARKRKIRASLRRSQRLLRDRRLLRQDRRRGLTLLQLLPASCRWPTGDSPDITFCGEQKADGSPYCLKHAVVASPNFGRPR